MYHLYLKTISVRLFCGAVSYFRMNRGLKTYIYRLIKILYRRCINSYVIRYVSLSNNTFENNFVIHYRVQNNGWTFKKLIPRKRALLSLDRKNILPQRNGHRKRTSAMLLYDGRNRDECLQNRIAFNYQLASTWRPQEILQFHWKRRCAFSSLMPAVRYHEVRGRYHVTACVTVCCRRARARAQLRPLTSINAEVSRKPVCAPITVCPYVRRDLTRSTRVRIQPIDRLSKPRCKYSH